MRCKRARIMISASIDGGLSRREESAVERHLSRCAACAREKAELTHLQDAMALWADEEPSAWLAENFAHRMKAQQEKRQPAAVRRPRWLVGTAAAGLATALLAFAILVTYQLQAPPVQPTKTTLETPAATQPAAEMAKPPTTQPAVKPAPDASPSVARPDGDKGTWTRLTGGENARPRPPVVSRPPRSPKRGTGSLISRGTPAPAEAERIVLKNIAAAGFANERATHAVTDELGEAELAVNESIERVRGTLRRAVDVLMASYAAPAIEDSETTDSDKGGTL